MDDCYESCMPFYALRKGAKHWRDTSAFVHHMTSLCCWKDDAKNHVNDTMTTEMEVKERTCTVCKKKMLHDVFSTCLGLVRFSDEFIEHVHDHNERKATFTCPDKHTRVVVDMGFAPCQCGWPGNSQEFKDKAKPRVIRTLTSGDLIKEIEQQYDKQMTRVEQERDEYKKANDEHVWRENVLFYLVVFLIGVLFAVVKWYV